MSETQNVTTTVSNVYFKCPFCKEEEMFEKGLQFPTLKELKRKHMDSCDKYARWITNNKPEEEEAEHLKTDGKQMMFARLKFALQKCFDIPRIKTKLSDPNISEAEKQYKIKGELREAEWIQEQQITEAIKLLKDENPHIRAGAQEEWNRFKKMGSMKQRWQEYRVF